MKAIVCIDENWGIGNNGKLLYSIPEDMNFFKEKTLNNIVIMGRKTLFSFKNKLPLKNRINIVLTKNTNIINDYAKFDNIIFVNDIENLQILLKKLKIKYPEKEHFVIGGEKIYKQLIDFCDFCYITKIFYKFVSDSYFPNIEKLNYKIIHSSEIKNYENIKYQFLTYKKEINL